MRWSNETKEYLDYIIGIDEYGEPKSYTSNPDKLSNYFGANPGAPHYLTPVFFKKEVLQRYLSRPDIFSVEAGYLRCQCLWGIEIDNEHKDVVSVYLGDLGRDLPTQEQAHWKQYNIATRTSITTVFSWGWMTAVRPSTHTSAVPTARDGCSA